MPNLSGLIRELQQAQEAQAAMAAQQEPGGGSGPQASGGDVQAIVGALPEEYRQAFESLPPGAAGGHARADWGDGMKTGRDVFFRAMVLLGYTGVDGTVDGAQSAELFRRGLDIVNQVAADLWPLEKEKEEAFAPLKALTQEIPLSASAVENILPYGVAAFLAQADGDGTNQQFFTSLYQQKRNMAERPLKRRGDVLPRSWEE